MVNTKPDYLAEDHAYKYRHNQGAMYYQHKPDDPCEPDLAHLFTWDSFPGKSSKLLELGCGDGFITKFLAAKRIAVEGVDCSPTAIEHARKNLGQLGLVAKFQVADVCDLSCYQDLSFKYILDSHCLHCLVDYRVRARFLKEVRRLLMPEGRFFIATMVEQSMHWIKEGGPDRIKYEQDARGCYIESLVFPEASARSWIRIFITESILREEVNNAGFKIIRWEKFASPHDPQDLSLLLELE